MIGNKAILQIRLSEEIANGFAFVEDRPVEEVTNWEGDTINTEAYWKLLEPEGPIVNNFDMTVDGVQYREPTMPAAEHERNAEFQPEKRDYREVFDRAPFISSVLLPVRNLDGKLKKKSSGEHVYEEQLTIDTHPDLEFLQEKCISLSSHPADYFDISLQRIE